MIDEAFISLQKKADKGNADAQFELALILLDEGGTDDDEWEMDSPPRKREMQEGARWLTQAALQGHRAAQTDLAKRYYYGINFPENPGKALEWFLKAADAGCPEAQFFIGELYTSDQVLPYDIETAVSWYERSAGQGFQWAQLALFDIYCHGADLIERDEAKCLYWGRKAAEQGNVSAQLGLGKLLFEGTFVTRNLYEAAFWLHLAADIDDEAAYYLAVLYYQGQGVPRNINKSAELFRKLATKGDTEAMVQLAIVLGKLPDVPHDEIKNWLLKATDFGHISARQLLDEMLAEEYARDPESFEQKNRSCDEFNIGDAELSIDECIARAEAGDRDAQYQLGQVFEDSQDALMDYQQAVRWYKPAAEAGHSGAQWRLSLCYQQGLGVLSDDVQATRYLKMAAEGGHSEAQLQLGLQYFHGSIVEQDFDAAFRLFRESANRWNMNALVWLGHCFQQGLGVEMDLEKAFDLFSRAAELGVVSGQFKLGIMYSRGLGVRHDAQAALHWLSLAGENGHRAALTELGRIYLEGDGVDQCQFRAETFFRRAAELFDEPCRFEVDRKSSWYYIR